MTDLEALAQLRVRIGDPSKNEVSNETLRMFFTSALQRLAHELKWNVPPATTITVAAQDYAVPLPDDLMWLLWVEANNLRLQPDSANRLILDSFSWRDQQPGTPSRYVIQGRTLILIPPPASDTEFTFSYIANSDGLQPGGITALPDADFQCAIYDAAIEFLSMFPGDTPEAQQKRTVLMTMNKTFYEREIANSRERRDSQAYFAQKALQVGGRRAYPSR